MTAARARTATNALPRISGGAVPASIRSGCAARRGRRLVGRHRGAWKAPGEPEREQRQSSDGSQRFPESVELGVAIRVGDRGRLAVGKARVARTLLDIRN